MFSGQEIDELGVGEPVGIDPELLELIGLQ